jgi:AraC-like DNA-binding protein
MADRLHWLLETFDLHADVFQAGELCQSAEYDDTENVGYIHILKEGHLELETAGQTVQRFNEPVLIFYVNAKKHRLSPLNDTSMVCATFHFDQTLGNPLTKSLPDVLCITFREMPQLYSVLQLLFDEANEHHCGQQSILNRLIEVTIILLIRYLMDQNKIHIGLLAGLADNKLAKAINAVHESPAKTWSLETLAEVAGMSRARFAAHFHQTVGITPHAYLTEWRISKAKSLLLRGKSLSYVVDAVGYSGLSAFSRAFYALVGMPPKAWLKQNEQAAPSGKPLTK